MTVAPQMSPDEPFRLQALHDLHLVDTPIEERFERLTRLAQRVLGADVVAISLVDSDRQYFKSIQGDSSCETGRDISFCGHAILEDDMFIVPDARKDPRFKDNPLVTGSSKVVFYAGMQIRSREGAKIGMLCMTQKRPREFSETDKQQLRDIAALVELEIHVASSQTPSRALIEACTSDERRALIDPVSRVWNSEGLSRLVDRGFGAAGSIWIAVLRVNEVESLVANRGDEVYDEIIRGVTKRLLCAKVETDTLARTAAHEFACVLSSCPDESEARRRAHELTNSVAAEPIRTPRAQVTISLTAGVAPLAGELAEAIAAAGRPTARDAA